MNGIFYFFGLRPSISENNRLWRDCWIPGLGRLEDQFLSSIPSAELNFSVSFYASINDWNWEVIENVLPDEVCVAITNVKPPAPSLPDFPSWSASSDGQFSLKSTYFLVFLVAIGSYSPIPESLGMEWPSTYEIYNSEGCSWQVADQ